MRVLVVVEHDSAEMRQASRCALGFAESIAEVTKGDVRCLVLGHQVDDVARQCAGYAPVIHADSRALANPVADRYAAIIARVVADREVEMVVAASTTFAKDIVGRAAALMGGAMVSDVISHEVHDGEFVFHRPMHAGSVVAAVTLHGSPEIVTIRPTAYQPPEVAGSLHEITPWEVDEGSLPSGITYMGVDTKVSHRPDVTEARVVVSGGRAIKNADDYERLVGGLADCLGGAAGSSRALVDAGVTNNALQVGQTGKIVAPELYIALGISGAVQHLAGMKGSKVVVAINQDSEAPIFEVADYGLIGDVYELVPQLIEALGQEKTL